MNPKIALITGANKGIGLETARQLARDHKFTVLLGARDEKRGQDAAKSLQSEGLDIQFLLIDPTDVATVERARTEVEEKFGHLDVLINNAGMMVPDDFAPPATVPTAAYARPSTSTSLAFTKSRALFGRFWKNPRRRVW